MLMILSSVVRKPSVSVKAVCSCLLLIGMTNSLPVDARNHAASANSKHRAGLATKSMVDLSRLVSVLMVIIMGR